MTKREIATLSFKVLSLYAFIKVIDKVSSLINYMYKYSLSEVGVLNFMIFASPLLLMLLCGGLLWFLAPWLASSISKSTAPEDNASASLLSIQAVAFSVVGLYLLADSLPALVRSIIWHFTTASRSMGERTPLIGDILGYMVQIFLGLWLLFGSRGIVNFIRSMRRD